MPSKTYTVQLLANALQTGSRQRAAASESRQHVLLLIDQFPAVLGGGERVLLRLARLLVAAGYSVSIVTFQIYCDRDWLQEALCPIYLLPIDQVFSSAAIRAAWQFGCFLRRERVSIVMTFFESSNLFGGLATKLLSRSRLIWNRRDMGILRERKHRMAYRYLSWLPDYVVAVSEEVRRHAIQVDRIPEHKVGVVYNGVDSKPSHREGMPATPVIITVGNVRAVKGHDTLIEAAAITLRTYPEAQFYIYGEVLERPFYEQMQERIAELSIGKQLQFMGSVADPVPLLRKSSIFVLPSRSEGFSNAIVEAMMSGLPVVSTTVGGNAEAVEQESTGLLVPPDQPEALAAALCRLLQHPEQLVEMGEAGQRRANERFSSDSMVERLTSIMQSLKY